ncbi:cellobiose phosphorylase [Mycoplasmatota bacterium]|nr:cellobiose phosphorylase [Mycoplasmatota bacterium]
MKLGKDIKTIEVKKDGITFRLLESGDILSINKDNIQLNQYRGNYIDGTVTNIYLRVKKNNQYKYTPLIGVKSPSEFKTSDNEVIYQGVFEEIKYQLKLTVFNASWFYQITLKNQTNEKKIVDVFYGQDVNLAPAGGNEAYISQYIDHQVFDNENGFVVCSRQNMFQPAYLQIGSMTKNIAYATDGFQFFGKGFKTKRQPAALNQKELSSQVYQYEFAYTCLQSESIDLIDEENIVFYGLYKDDHKEAVTQIEYTEEVLNDYHQLTTNDFIGNFSKVSLSIDVDDVINGCDLQLEEVNTLFPNRYHEECDEGLLSFYLNNKSHVVLKRKEQLVERPHGHILLNGNVNEIKDNVYSTTNFMYGIFNSQIVCGNTSFNKMISNARNALNLLKTSGQRIYVKLNGCYQILNMPSAYEMGLNYTKWYYKLSNEMIIVTVYTNFNGQTIVMDIESTNQHDFMITNHMVMGVDEYAHQIEYLKEGNSLTFKVDSDTFTANQYPNLTFKLESTQDFTVVHDEIFYEDKLDRCEPLVNLLFNQTKKISLQIKGDVHGQIDDNKVSDLSSELTQFINYYQENVNHFNISINNESSQEIDKFNYLIYWYTHNALIHYASPHGLEQYGGAAWGTRDVCQGPFEYFLATQKFSICKAILKKVYAHQFLENGDWPQWFMFDKYSNVQASESHGDIIVWPLRSLALYLKATSDYSILDEEMPYVTLKNMTFTEEKETLLSHVKKQIEHMTDNLIQNTHLSIYGDGDWDDTLQPANPELRKNMVSGWTTALTYEAFHLLSEYLNEENLELKQLLKELSIKIKEDYLAYVIKDKVPAGFLLFDQDKIKYIVHPEDKKTGVKYRLLPINRCFISGLFDKEDVNHYFELVKEHLYHPDGVRLMDTTVNYQGGVNTYFKRAEQAANFGREIGLQYVHAHIRFVEAMAKIGYKDEVYKGLMRINPINIQKHVPNAEIRQSNCYFSSSDAKFNNRYEAMKNFDKLRTGDVAVKGGWRVYSSGPGIYLYQLICNFLGIRIEQGDLLLDPQIPTYLNGLTFQYRYMNKIINFHYQMKENQKINQITINGNEVKFSNIVNPYRVGGAIIKKEVLEKYLTEDINKINIML